MDKPEIRTTNNMICTRFLYPLRHSNLDYKPRTLLEIWIDSNNAVNHTKYFNKQLYQYLDDATIYRRAFTDKSYFSSCESSVFWFFQLVFSFALKLESRDDYGKPFKI